MIKLQSCGETLQFAGTPEHTRHVEITFVCHSHPVFSEAAEDDGERYRNYAEIKAEIDNRGGPIVSNYRQGFQMAKFGKFCSVA